MEIFLSPFDLIDIFTGYYFQPSSSQRRVHPLHGGTTTIRAKKNYFQGWYDSSRSKQEARWNCQGNIILTSSSFSGTNPSRLFEHQSNHFKDVCRVHTRNGTEFFFLLFLNDGAIGWRASSRLSCPGWWMEISSLSFNTHSTRRLNWSPSYFSLRTCNTTATLPSLSCCPPHFFSHGRSFVHREAGTSNVNKRGSRAVSQKGRI